MELLPRVELGTSSLPRMRSTTELKQHKSERRDSNPRPPAWKASALSTELLSRNTRGKLSIVWVRMDSNHRSRRQQIYSLPHLATLEHTLFSMFTLISAFLPGSPNNFNFWGERRRKSPFPFSGAVWTLRSYRRTRKSL